MSPSPSPTPYNGPLALQFNGIVAALTSPGSFACSSVSGLPSGASESLGLAPAAGATPYLSDSIQLGAVVQLSDPYCTGNVTWSSSNSTVARVDSTGLVSAGSATGSAIITATTVQPTSYAVGAPMLTATSSITVSDGGGAVVTIQ